jgi:hypothetical protein
VYCKLVVSAPGGGVLERFAGVGLGRAKL